MNNKKMKSEAIINYVFDKIRRFHLSPKNKLCHVGTYTRELPINLDRMYENAIDGEHLPYLHSSTFSYINILESGPWGWRAKAGLRPRSRLTDMEIQLVLNRDEYCWKTTTLAGLGKGTEIWTHAIPLDKNNIKVVVNFYVPKLPSFLRSFYEDYYKSTYQQLYDEDLMMMSERQEALDLKKDKSGQTPMEQLSLGLQQDILKQLPHTFTFNQHKYCLNRIDGELIAYSAMCPHMLGPLENADVVNGTVECPWHAYRFDVRNGNCLSGQTCRLKPSPTILIDPDTDEILARLN